LGIANDEDDDGTHASQPAASRRGPNSAGVITGPQIARLWAIAREKDVSEDEVKSLMLSIAGVDSSKEIPVAKYDELVEAVESAALPF
jgi:hypothetical protein